MTWWRVGLYYALFGLALAYYWGSGGSTEEPRVEAPVEELALVDTSLDRLAEVHIIREGKRVRCAQEAGRWRVVEPPRQRVPVDLISSFVTTLLEVRPAELIAAEAADVDPFGLRGDALRVELYQHGKDAPVTVILGNQNPTGTAVYARVEGSPRVLLVGRILEYYVERIFEEVEKPAKSSVDPAVDIDRIDRTG